jgi:hypothetical protein
MEKTLRETTIDELQSLSIHPLILPRADHVTNYYLSKADAKLILSLLSTRIKAKALTDDNICHLICGHNCFTDKTTCTGLKLGKSIAAAQLQAILKELDIKENK